MIRIEIGENGRHNIVDDVLEENGWIIVEMEDHSWALYENLEWYTQEIGRNPFKYYANHELGDAIKQAQQWT
jgi:hypothetical protein